MAYATGGSRTALCRNVDSGGVEKDFSQSASLAKDVEGLRGGMFLVSRNTLARQPTKQNSRLILS